MSVLISGMNMPTRCAECNLSTFSNDWPLCVVLNEYMNRREWAAKRLDKCPLIGRTNYDEIHSMNLEELAEFLTSRDLDDVEKLSKAAGFTYKVDRDLYLFNVTDWLKQEGKI